MDKALRAIRTTLNAIMAALLAAVLSTAIAIVVVPAFFSGTNLVVLSGSMEPGIKPGDVVVTRGIDQEREANLSIGDVIAFLPYPDDPTVVTHRILGVTTRNGETYYITKGDNNDSTDPWGPVASSHVRGTVMYTVPKIGYVKQWAKSHAPAAITVAGALLIGYGAFTFWMSFKQPTRSAKHAY